MSSGPLRLVQGAIEPCAEPPEAAAYQSLLIEGYIASQVARGYSELTIGNGTGTLERFLVLCERPVWEVRREDVDRVVGALAAAGLSTSTRRGYVSIFKGFFTFLVARKASEIEAFFGLRLEDPIDEFNAARHVGADSPNVAPPPTPQRMDEFFEFLRAARPRKDRAPDPAGCRCSTAWTWC